MKSVLIALSLLASLVAQAEVRSEVAASKLSYDGKMLNVEYRVGGGCAKHTAQIEVSLGKVEHNMAVATVKLLDVTPTPDYCEALIYKKESFNLSEKIAEAVNKQDQKIYRLSIDLPQVEAQLAE